MDTEDPVTELLAASSYANPGYFLRVMIAIDDFLQAASDRGILGITISARSGTAEVHGHRWGIILSRMLDHHIPLIWPFGKDPKTGERHVVGAIRGDRWRAVHVLQSLWKYYPDPKLIKALQDLLNEKSNASN
jgi:hypothetical protein